MRAWFIAIVGAVAVASVSAPADAWSVKSPFRASINSHTFDRVELDADSCTIAAGLYFDAPSSAYDGKNEVRNTYRFRALVKLRGGRSFETRVFQNRAAGRRKYVFSHDTTSEGCWAERSHEVIRVDVVGCRNRGCIVPGFQ